MASGVSPNVTLEDYSMSSLFAVKSMETLRAEAAETGEHSLKRVLGPVNLITLGIGAIIGTGIFVLTGQAAAQYAGPAIVLSMLLAGFASALAGLCYAEFASSVPIAGSAYTYGYATLGEFFAWIIGWDLILEYALGAATVAVGWSGYVVSFLADFGILLPPAYTAPFNADLVQTSPGHWQILAANLAEQLRGQGIDPASLQHVTGIINLPAMLIAALVTILLVIGIKESANVNSVIVIVKVAVVLLVIVAGTAFVKTANWHPFIPTNRGSFGDFGWSGIARGAGVIFFAYIGFDAVSTAAQEAKNPQRDMPIGILGSLVICTVLYVAVSLVMVGLVPYTQLGGHLLGRSDQHPAVPGQAGRDRGPELGHGRHDAWTAAHLLLDGPRRSAARLGEEDPPTVPDAAHHHDCDRCRRGIGRGLHADYHSGRTGQRGHVAGLRNRVARDHLPPEEPP
jgi:basic amino acid/polyamine antiporter, APA family